jgi:hypothetical protein
MITELYTRDQLFPDIETEQQLVEQVANQRLRPPIPASCPTSLKNLMQQCWEHDPRKRVSDTR